MNPIQLNNDSLNPSAFCLKHKILLGVLLGSFVLAFFPEWKRLIEVWYSSEDHSHGFFIIPICTYIIYQKRDILRRTPINGSSWGFPLLLFSLMSYVFSQFAEILTLSSFSLVMTIGSALLFSLGREILRLLSFPLFLLLFMIPVPAQIYASLTIPLQLMVTEASAWLSVFIGLPIYREGNVIHLPHRTLEVVQSCSGLRSMVIMLTFSVVFGYLTLRSNVLRSILFILGIPLTVLVNVVRVFVTVIAFYYLNIDLSSGTAHTALGVAIFALASSLLLIIRGFLSHWEQPTEKA